MDKLLSKIKWKIVAPVAKRFGLSNETLERLQLSPKMRHIVRGRFITDRVRQFLDVKPQGAGGSAFNNARGIGQVFETIALAFSPEDAEKWLAFVRDLYPEFHQRIEWAPIHGYFNIDTRRALDLAEQKLATLSPDEDAKFIRFIAAKYLDAGYINRPIEILEMIPEDEPAQKALKLALGRKQLLDEGVPLPERAGKPVFEPTPRKSLYLLHNSLPFASGGYATRTHGLSVGAARNDWTVECLTRLGFPKDVDNKRGWQVPNVSVIGGINYHRALDKGNPYREMDSREYLVENARYVEAHARKLKPSIIHGASNHINGIAANIAARRLGIKSIFEVRGLWELTRMSRQPSYYGSEAYNQVVRLETEAAAGADAVITITDALKNLMAERGIPAEKITVIPNGVDCSRFRPHEKDEDLVEEYKLQGKTIIGFVGSMPQYEGLDDLLRALRILVERGRTDFHFLAVGDGDEFTRLCAVAEDLKLNDFVTFTGRVPHEEVEKYYSVIDVAPFPRKRQPVCEVVSPLKPFEAMAMAKTVLVSDVEALQEIVVDGERGLHFEAESAQSIADTLIRVMDDPDLCRRLGEAGMEWVRAERDWRVLSRKLVDVYESLA